MNIFDFQALLEVTDFKELENPVVGTKFLYGTKMINQKHLADIGREISYFEVISVKDGGKGVEYKTKYERLEKPMMRED